jgi:hypothetical protein
MWMRMLPGVARTKVARRPRLRVKRRRGDDGPLSDRLAQEYALPRVRGRGLYDPRHVTYRLTKPRVPSPGTLALVCSSSTKAALFCVGEDPRREDASKDEGRATLASVGKIRGGHQLGQILQTVRPLRRDRRA